MIDQAFTICAILGAGFIVGVFVLVVGEAWIHRRRTCLKK